MQILLSDFAFCWFSPGMGFAIFSASAEAEPGFLHVFFENERGRM
jgi:hypothetical protein